jgi:HemK-related putative methylase
MTADIHKALSIVTRCLKREGYGRIQYYPKGRGGYLAHEFLVLRSFLLKDNVSLLRTSGLHAVYDRLMRGIYPKLHDLYRLFFRCEESPLAVFRKFFDQDEIDLLRRDGLLMCADERCRSRYRFVPVDDLMMISSPESDAADPDYLPIEGDAVILWHRLRRSLGKPAKDALEIGCGTGFLSIWLARIAHTVTATDINERALELTRWNAGINGIENVLTLKSDVYSDVRGKFDLILANPPFIFLPHECAGKKFIYGGHLGLETVEKILVGLDRHLNDKGISYILAMSYISENGIDALSDLVKSLFHGKPYSIALQQLDYLPLPIKYSSFYRKNRISYSILYLIRIQRGEAYEFSDIPIRGVSKAIAHLKIRRLKSKSAAPRGTLPRR